MNPQDVGLALLAALGPDATLSTGGGEAEVTVPIAQWVPAATAARDTAGVAATFFDCLLVVDETDGRTTVAGVAAGFDVVLRVWSPPLRHAVQLRTRVPVAQPALPTLTGVYAGADWHERQALEMFGVVAQGHPHLVPLLLPDGFEGHPLRKDFVLASRAVTAWPGSHDPADSGVGRGRRRAVPPGVPTEGTWGRGPGTTATDSA